MKKELLVFLLCNKLINWLISLSKMEDLILLAISFVLCPNRQSLILGNALSGATSHHYWYESYFTKSKSDKKWGQLRMGKSSLQNRGFETTWDSLTTSLYFLRLSASFPFALSFSGSSSSDSIALRMKILGGLSKEYCFLLCAFQCWCLFCLAALVPILMSS